MDRIEDFINFFQPTITLTKPNGEVEELEYEMFMIEGSEEEKEKTEEE